MADDFYRELGPAGLAALVEPAKTRADIALARRLCRGAGRVLDLACGYGRIALPLAAAGLAVEGIDLDAGLIAQARRDARGRGLPLRYRVGDMRALPYADGSFARVLCLWSSFQHLPTLRDQRACLAEVVRVLAPGGRAYLEMTDGSTPAIERRLAREGRGPGRRIARWRLNGAEISCYLHNQQTLSHALAPLRGATWTVTHRIVHGVRRLTAELVRDGGPGRQVRGRASG